MSTSRMADPTLHLTRVQVPWGEHTGKLMLATPRIRRSVKPASGTWERSIFEALLGLRTKADFHQKQEAQDLWKLSAPRTSTSGSGARSFFWPGWDHLILPFPPLNGSGRPSRGMEGWYQLLEESGQEHLPISFLPTTPPNGIESWPHGLLHTVREAHQILQEGGGNVLYLDVDHRGTAAFLPAALSLLSDPMVHPQKAVHGLLHAGLGLSPFHFGVLLGMGERRS